MIQIMPKSALLSHLIVIITQLKWAWDFVLHQSFFQPREFKLLQDYADNLNITRYEKNISSDESVECAVCLCRIDEGDEIRELRCDHLFHKVCLDRWLGCGHVTCPLCRNNLKPRRFAAEELIMFDFCAATSRDDRCKWWLR
ncbi:hypothetical protein CASFOL_024278 [Castilleja foliolosa]|uniref:RING-type domain-containing protein n=1 Tax=Castilleja foliolosa TaxID=1961234 RepID=A0ABD3CQ72_9LAMI